MEVYRDFLYYGSGIYVSDHYGFLGLQYVRIIGWGVENGINYWVCSNNWGTSWGERGYFRIAENECSINEEVNTCSV